MGRAIASFDTDEQPSQAARIVSEICERLEELEATTNFSSSTLIIRLAELATKHPPAYRLTIQLMHGNAASLSQFKRIDPSRRITRQAASQRLDRTIRFLRTYSPPIAAYIERIRSLPKVPRYNDAAHAMCE